MDPALIELYEEGSGEDEVSVILRLREGAGVPPRLRVVGRFGRPTPTIVTARCHRGDIPWIYDREEVFSMKAPGRVELAEPVGEGYGRADFAMGLQARPKRSAYSVSVPENGAGVLVGIIDYGFDFTHPNLRTPQGKTRLRALWDQGAPGGEGLSPYGYGRLYTREEIDFALGTADPIATLGYDPRRADPRGNGAHGTHVADILAGNRSEPGSEVGLASASEIVFVDLAAQRAGELENFGDSVQLLEALDFVRNQAGEEPLVVNLSAGKTGGPHNGTELFSQALDALLLERTGIGLGQSVGNYAASRMATHARVGPDQQYLLYWLISPDDRTPNELEIWYSGRDRFDVSLIAPNGSRFSAALGERVKLIQDGVRWGTLHHRHNEPNSRMNHIDVMLRTASPPGRYQIEVHGRDVVDGRFHAWIERDAGGRHQSHFLGSQASSRYTTNTIANSLRGIAVGAYYTTAGEQLPGQAQTQGRQSEGLIPQHRPPTSFSSRGPTADGRQKPELVAPGFRIRAARSIPRAGWSGESRLTVKSGTSMAAPWVTGTMALMQQAAGRGLSIAEMRRILIGTADPVPGPPGRSHTRLGYGYLNIPSAIDAARRLGREGSTGNLAFTLEEPGDTALEWAPRWIVDPQPFEHEAEDRPPAYSEDPNRGEADHKADAEGDQSGHDWEGEITLSEATSSPLSNGTEHGCLDEGEGTPRIDFANL